ncbi:MAG: 1-acyl-sn-glycerol-3-phosphate acyltransferase [Bacteroidaceae bacterium]|nr:1-acyl-sn-glycerol-3-phosphate acyltransferase [Bacteroidaceae bacterium]
MLRKILHPLYVLYQVLFAWWAFILLTIITSIIVIVFGAWLKIKNADHYPAVIWCRLSCWIFLIPVKVVDRDKFVKKDKNYIFVANHQGMFDVITLYAYVLKNYKWIMKDSLRKVPFMGAACAMTEHIFVNRTTPQKDMLRKAINVLKSGKSLTVFAEGTRCLNGKLGRFKKGAFVIANMTQKPIIPITIEGSYDLLPKGCWCLHWSKVTLTFHEEIKCQGRDTENVEYLMRTTRNVIAKDLGAEIEPEPVKVVETEPTATQQE